MRHYYRCLDCLNVCAADGPRLGSSKCGACGGPCEWMGQVQGARLTDRIHLCACDGRCTGAIGPSCDCSCGGANHGSGRVVAVDLDMGPVPVLRAIPCDKLRRIADEWRTARDAARAERDALRNSGRFLAGDKFARLCYLNRKLTRAGAARSHKGRMDILRALGHVPTVAADPKPMWELV